MQPKTKWYLGVGVLVIVAALWLSIWSFTSPSRQNPLEPSSVPKKLAPPPPVRVTPTSRLAGGQLNSLSDVSKELNAADTYRQAFALYDALSKEDKDLLADWKTEVDPAKAAELLQKIQPILDLLRQAAATGKCDWGLGKISFTTTMPHLGQGRNISRVALWGAAQTFKSDPNVGVNIIASQLQLGKSVGDGALIGMLVNSSMQRGAMELICTNATRLNTTATDKLVSILGATDYDEGFFRSMESEGAMMVQSANDIELGKEPLIGALWSNATPTEAASQIRQMADLQRGYVKAIESSEIDAAAWSNRIAAIIATNQFAAELMPAYDKVLEQARRTRVERAMISAGLSYRQEGATALTKFTDPATGQPFIFEPTTNGFRLRSAFTFREQPVVMSFPR